MNYARIASIATRLDSHCVVGGYALAARGYVRQTADFDLMTTDRQALVDAFWEAERREGLSVVVDHGDMFDPLAGSARIRSADLDLDVVVASTSGKRLCSNERNRCRSNT